MAAILFLNVNSPDFCLVALLAAYVPAKAHGADEFVFNECAHDEVLGIRRETPGKNRERRRAMLLGRFAESAGLAFQGLQAQMPERLGMLRTERPNLYIHLEASVAVIPPYRLRLILFATAVAAGQLPAQEPPDPASQQKILADATQYATNREQTLPDFICTQTTRRFADYSKPDPLGRDEWRPLDIIVERLTYFGHHEDYRVLEINGVAASVPHEKLGGASSSGEFGSVMKGIFAPVAQTQFHWQTWFTLRGEKMNVYAYRVEKANSDYHIVVPGQAKGPNVDLLTAYHGLVFIDDHKHYIHRVTLHPDGIPPDFPVQDVSLILDYDYTRIGAADYLLPLTFELRSREGSVRMKNDVDYDNYRKFAADSSVRFGGAPVK